MKYWLLYLGVVINVWIVGIEIGLWAAILNVIAWILAFWLTIWSKS